MLRDCFGVAPRSAYCDKSRECNFAILYGDFHVTGIDMPIVRQGVANVVLDALIRALVPSGALSAMAFVDIAIGVPDMGSTLEMTTILIASVVAVAVGP